MKVIAAAALVATGLFATATFAQETKMDPSSEAGLAEWAVYDADQSGSLSYEEVIKKYGDLKKSDFDAADANRDGVIEKEELAALQKVVAK